MKIVMLNTSDRQGGAAVAASRLREALIRSGVDVTLIVREKTSDDPGVISVNDSWFRRKLDLFRFLWERLVIFTRNGFSRKKLFQVSIADTGTDFSKIPEVRNADIIHLHWINQGLLSLEGLRKLAALGKPIVWTLHDMWPLTGICHHAWTCERYQTECGRCPFLDSQKDEDLSTRIFREKKKLYSDQFTLIPVSRWLMEKCSDSALTRSLPAMVIPNTIDTGFFTPGDKTEARRQLGLPADKKIVVMGAARIDDPIKGFALLREALEQLDAKHQDGLLLVLFGNMKDEDGLLFDLPVDFNWQNRISDPDRLRALYRSADVVISSSHYETFGQTLSEAMACGCPAVSFGNSGQQDIIDHLQNGYLAHYPDAGDLASGLRWILDSPIPEELSQAAREKILRSFTINQVSSQYLNLYQSLLK